jgi:hypothetical protein
MNKTCLSLAVLCALAPAFAPAAMAGPKEYPMTGPIIALTDTTVVVQQAKTHESWEFARSPDLKGMADLKVGDRVTVHYTMVAVSVERKAEKAPGAPAAAATPAGSPAKAVAGH